MNKRGWIKIVEAFVSVLLIAGVLLYMINQGYIGKSDISEQVYQAQISVLREIELNNEMRAEILSVSEDNLPVKWENFTDYYLEDIKSKIEDRIPDYLKCVGKVCELDKVCEMEQNIDKDVYAQAVAIAAEGDIYSPRQLKLFCWTK